VPNVEKQLAERAAKRDREAFAKLYDLYADKIYKYIYYKSGRTDEAEDLTAQVFLKAWEAIEHYKWEGYPFSTWLYRIAHNQMIDHYRTHRETFPLDTARTRESGLDPLESAEKSFSSAQIRGAIRHLTQDQQRVIILRFLEGYSTAEVANILDKDPDAIRALQHRALRALQPWMVAARLLAAPAQAQHARVGA
jgi:RNA polymerase sigma-70 factor (ECF subfamily)